MLLVKKRRIHKNFKNFAKSPVIIIKKVYNNPNGAKMMNRTTNLTYIQDCANTFEINTILLSWSLWISSNKGETYERVVIPNK